MRRALCFGICLLAPVLAAAKEPSLDDVPARLRTSPAGRALDANQKERLRARKVIVERSPAPEGGVDVVHAMTIIDARPRQVFSVLRDYAHLHEFMPHMKSATVDEHRGKRWLVSYVIRGPMGIGNRDYQLEVFDDEEQVDGVDVLVSRQAYTNKGNIAATRAKWQLIPIDDGRATLVRYSTRTDIGGDFSLWLKNKTAASALPKVMEGIRTRAAAAPDF